MSKVILFAGVLQEYSARRNTGRLLGETAGSGSWRRVVIQRTAIDLLQTLLNFHSILDDKLFRLRLGEKLGIVQHVLLEGSQFMPGHPDPVIENLIKLAVLLRIEINRRQIEQGIPTEGQHGVAHDGHPQMPGIVVFADFVIPLLERGAQYSPPPIFSLKTSVCSRAPGLVEPTEARPYPVRR